MKATHRMFSIKNHTEWHLAVVGGRLFYKRISPPTNGKWHEDDGSLQEYEKDKRFLVLRYSQFKGNK